MPKPRKPKTVQLPSGRKTLDSWTRELDAPSLPFIIRVTGVIEEGRLLCDRLELQRREGAPGITTEAMREVAVGRILSALAPTVHESGASISPEATVAVKAESVTHAAPAITIGGGTHSVSVVRRPVTPERLRRIAAIVREARALGEPASRAVSRVESIRTEHALRLMKRARDEIDPETEEPYLEGGKR